MSQPARMLYLAAPRGFCAGVDRAIDIVEMALDVYGAPVYVRHEIVHNRHVVDALRERGAVFSDHLDGIPAGSVLVLSAHGVSPAVRQEAKERGLRTLDATCPLVTKVHLEALRFAREGYTIILVGHPGHVEVEGTMGEAPDRIVLVSTVDDAERVAVADPARVACITQTTLSVDDTRAVLDALRRRFPAMREPAKDDICYATQNRQDAVKELARRCGVILVVGAPTSSNSNRLVEVSESMGTRAYLVEEASDVRPEWIAGTSNVGVTAGASAPENVVQQVTDRVRSLGEFRLEEFKLVDERVMFPLPGELLAVAQEKGVSVGAGNERAAARGREALHRVRHH